MVLDCAHEGEAIQRELQRAGGDFNNRGYDGNDECVDILVSGPGLIQLDESHLRHNDPRPAHIDLRRKENEALQQSATALVCQNFGMEDNIQLTWRVLENSDIVVRRSSGIL